MKDIELLELLIEHYTEQKHVANSMYWAMQHFERGREDYSWLWLFYWCEDIDRREELWKQFKHHYPRAVMLKEGYTDD